MDERDSIRVLNQTPGPVITISREHGCDAMYLADHLMDMLQGEHSIKKHPWRCINKEILSEASKELHVSIKKITIAMDTRQELIVQDIFSSFTHHYGVTNKNILDTIKDVLKSYCNEGKVIIVGRGGALIARDIESSLHIKLQAPFEWRVMQIQAKYGLSTEEARSQCVEMDEKRSIWNKQLAKDGLSNSNYDVVINSQTISTPLMIELLTPLIKSRKIIH